MIENGKRYVTFGWLLGACGATLTSVIVVAIFAINQFGSALEKKVDKEVFAYVCNDIKEIKDVVNANALKMEHFSTNQIRVMEKLGIVPMR